MTAEEWVVILELTETGYQESPWAWSSSWPKGIAADDKTADKILHKFREFVQQEKTK